MAASSTTLPAPLEPESLASLRDDSHILALLHHRNRNQHRLTKWYQHLTTLHRHLRNLVRDADTIKNAKLTSERVAAIAGANQRIIYLRDIAAPRAYDAFGMVVRDKQFVSLGVVMMAVLARVWEVLGGPAAMMPEEEVAEVEVNEAVEDGEDGMVISRDSFPVGGDDGAVLIRDAYVVDEDDDGMVISREDFSMDEEEKRIEVKITSTLDESDSAMVVKKKRRRVEITEVEGTRTVSSSEVLKKRKRRRPETALEVEKVSITAAVKESSKKKKRTEVVEKTVKVKTKKTKKKKSDDDLDALFSGIF